MSGSSAGYSGKPAWQKLGLGDGVRVRVCDPPDDYARLVGAAADALDVVGARAAFDVVHVFATRRADLARRIGALVRRLPANAALWVSWPKQASGVATDIVEDTVRDIALPLGLVDVKVCAVDAVWSGLKLVWRREHRAGKATLPPRSTGAAKKPR